MNSEDPKLRSVPGQGPWPGLLGFVREEVIDHLIPWTVRYLRERSALAAAGVGLAVVVSFVWLLGASGRLGPGAIIGWWLGWSAYEVLARRQCKPWIKDGPWWQRRRVPASLPDTLSYVATKNLLIGVSVYLALRIAGVLDYLHGLPSLKWLY